MAKSTNLAASLLSPHSDDPTGNHRLSTRQTRKPKMKQASRPEYTLVASIFGIPKNLPCNGYNCHAWRLKQLCDRIKKKA